MGPGRTTQDCDVEDCNRPTYDSAYICAECGTHLTRRLESILDEITPGPRGPRADLGGKIGPLGPDHVTPGLASSLDVAITKQARFTQLPGSSRNRAAPDDGTRTVLAEHPLPFGYAASEALTVLRSTLATWTALIAQQRGLPHPAYTLTDLALFLTRQVQWLRQQPAGHETFDEILPPIRNAWRTVDRPQDRIYAGPCIVPDEHAALTDVLRQALAIEPCTGHLYAREGSNVATCDACARDMPLDDARDPLLAQIDAMTLTGPEIATALGGLGSPINQNTIRTWAHRGLLTNHAPPGERPRYLVRDVRTLADARTTTREAVPA